MSLSQIILLFFIACQICSLTCGGNCPDNSCDQCPCGNVSVAADIQFYCNFLGSTNEEKNCCKCIIAQKSKGNQNFMQKSNNLLQIGVLWLGKGISTDCDSWYPAGLCEHNKNLVCARRIFINDQRTWKRWANEAKACGCPISLQEIKQ